MCLIKTMAKTRAVELISVIFHLLTTVFLNNVKITRITMRQPDGFIEVIEVGEIFVDIRLNSAGSFRAE